MEVYMWLGYMGKNKCNGVWKNIILKVMECRNHYRLCYLEDMGSGVIYTSIYFHTTTLF